MGDYLKLKKSNCKNCYKCIRHCPVKSIKFSDDQALSLIRRLHLMRPLFCSLPPKRQTGAGRLARSKSPPTG